MSFTSLIIGLIVVIVVMAIIFLIIRTGLKIIAPPTPVPEVVWLIVTVICLLWLVAVLTGNFVIPPIKGWS